jgi:hypothetical protein
VSLSGAIASFKTGDYEVVRYGAPTFEYGIAVAPSNQIVEIAACVQPVTGRLLQLLPEGQRADETKVIFTTAELFTRGPAHDPDKVIINGDYYRVFRVDRYQAFGGDGSGDHFRALVALDSPQTLEGMSDNTLDSMLPSTLELEGLGITATGEVV